MKYQHETCKSRDDVWPLRRADGRKWNEPKESKPDEPAR